MLGYSKTDEDLLRNITHGGAVEAIDDLQKVVLRLAFNDSVSVFLYLRLIIWKSIEPINYY